AKEEDKVRRQQEKEEKSLLIEERKRIREFNKSMRMQEAEEKAAKQAALQLQNDINYANKGKKKATESTRAKEEGNINNKSEEEVEEASAMVNRRGRQIRLPQR